MSHLPSAESLDLLIAHRRTIGPPGMSDEPVPFEQIERLLRNAAWAPTHGMTEPWRFTVVVGEAREALAAALLSAYDAVTPSAATNPAKRQKLAEVSLKAPVTIVLGMRRDPSGRISELDEIAAVACAVQNMHLTAAQLGLAAKWSSPAAAAAPSFVRWIGLEPPDRCLGLFYVGHPADAWPSSRRVPPEAFTTWRGR